MWKPLHRLMDPNADAGAAPAPAPAADPGKGGNALAAADEGGAAPVAVNPADARKFVADFVDDPKSIEGWDDAKVTAYHQKLTATLDKVRPAQQPMKPQDWPDDWRQKYAKDDKAKLNVLERYTSPQAALDALFAAKQAISKGVATTLPKDATPEQVAEFRKTNGIPEKPDDYKVELADGRVVGDADKGYVAEFLKEMHAENARPAEVNRALNFYFASREAQIAQRQEKDGEERDAVVEELRSEYGPDFKRNMNQVKNFLGEAGQDVFSRLNNARDADGKLILNDPATIRWFAKMAREISPLSAYLPGGDDTAVKAMSDEIKTIEGKMGDLTSEYWKGKKVTVNGHTDTELAHRYRELITIRDRANKKAA